MTNAVILEARSLRKRFSEQSVAVQDVSLSVVEGETVCLLGPSGCGKTTLLRLIAGLEVPDAGQVWFDGRDMANVPPHRRDFGMMFQDFALFPHKDVFENVAYGLQMHGRSSRAISQRVQEMLELVDLAGFEERSISQLSGGEQQRVALARALAPGPRLLMLDEPLGALDRALRERLMLQLRRILNRVGVTSIYVTHDQTEAFAVADQVAVMNAGLVEQIDTPEAVYAAPATPFVAQFLGFANILPGTVTKSGAVRTRIGDFAVGHRLPAPGTEVCLLIRPGAATVVAQELPSNGGGLLATIKDVSFRGKYFQVRLDVAGQELVFEMTRAPGTAGEEVALHLETEAIQVLSSCRKSP